MYLYYGFVRFCTLLTLVFIILVKAKRKEEKQAKWLAQLRGEATKVAKAAATSDAAATVTAGKLRHCITCCIYLIA